MSYNKRDDFKRSNVDPIAGNWLNLALSGYVNYRIVSNELKQSATTNAAFYFDDGDTVPNDQAADVFLSSLLDTVSYLGVLVRVSTAGGGQGYGGYIGPITLGSTAHVGIQKISGGIRGGDLVGGTSVTNISIGSHIAIAAIGSKITVWVDGYPIISYTDGSPIASGKTGIFTYTPTNKDNLGMNLFEARDAGVVAYAQPAGGYGHVGAALDTMQAATRRNKGFVLGNVPLIGGARGKNNGQIFP